MNLNKKVRLGMALSMLLSSLNVQAAPVTTIRDWSLWETNDNNYSVCFVESSDAAYNTYIRISKTKNNPADPAEIMIRLGQNTTNSTGMVANIKGAPQISFADMAGDKLTFWGIPKNLSTFTAQIHGAKETLKVRGVGGKKEMDIPISSQGFKYIVDEFQKRCNNGQSFLTPEFEQEFLSAIPDNVNPTALDRAKTGELRNLYFFAHRAIVDKKAVQQELAQLLSKYQGFLDEQAANRSSAQQIETVSLPTARTELSNTQAAQREARAELAKIEAMIPGLSAKVERSQQTLSAAEAVLAPLVPQHDAILANLASARSELSEAQNRLAYVDGRLRDGANQLASLRSESDSINSWLPQRRSDRDRAASFYRQAQADRANYNTTWERDRRLRNDWEYSRLQSERSNMQANQRQAEQDAHRARVERERVAADLQRCRNGMEGLESIKLAAAGKEAAEPRPPGLRPGPPGNGGGLVPGPRPGPQPVPQPVPQPPPVVRPPAPQPQPVPQPVPQPPPVVRPPPGGGGGLVPGPGPSPQPHPVPMPPPPPPRPNCSHLEQALMVADRNVADRDQTARNYASRVREIESQMDRVENRIDWEVRQEYNNLVTREDNARREYDRLDSEVDNAESRMSQINNVDIPRLQNEQSALQSERPSVVSRISQAQSAVNNTSQELSRFEAANDWGRKAGAVDSARAQLSQDQARLDAALEQKSDAQTKLNNNIAAEQSIQQRIASLTVQLNTLNARNSELSELLKNLPSERAPLDQKIATRQSEVENYKNQFLQILK